MKVQKLEKIGFKDVDRPEPSSYLRLKKEAITASF